MRSKSVIAAVFIAMIIPGTEIQAKNWSGPYFGLNFGDDENGKFNSPSFVGIFGGNISGSKSFAFGLQAGYNYQNGPIILGAETDVSWFNNKTSLSNSFSIPNIVLFESSAVRKEDWLTTFRLKAGYAPDDNILFYATGGFAVSKINAITDFVEDILLINPPLSLQVTGSLSRIMTGPVFGLGTEFRLTDNVSMKAEYLRYEFGSAAIPLILSINGVVTGPIGASTFNTTGNIFRLGINFDLD
jgi:outer membrane immunogenic protein